MSSPIEVFRKHLHYRPQAPGGMSPVKWGAYFARLILAKFRQVLLGKVHKDLENALNSLEYLHGEIRGGFEKSQDYLEFENQFRGDPEDVKKRFRQYIPLIKPGHIIDLGCGRGEFLSVLKEVGQLGLGVDSNASSVEEAKKLGLMAFFGDLVDFLEAQKNDELDTIFSAHVIEHISFPTLVALIKSSFNKLKPEGKLILETPNPQALIVFTEAYYLDPTHLKMIHPLTLKFVCERAGFKKVHIHYSSAASELHFPQKLSSNPELAEIGSKLLNLNNLLFGHRDYAIIAEK